MIKITSEHGDITISNAVFTTITGAACQLLRRQGMTPLHDGRRPPPAAPRAMSKGVKVTYNDDNTVSIELHIMVDAGVNIATVCRAIMSEVKYVVTCNTGVEVRDVNVCVDSVSKS